MHHFSLHPQFFTVHQSIFFSILSLILFHILPTLLGVQLFRYKVCLLFVCAVRVANKGEREKEVIKTFR